ncbi:MAG TPA: polysaccharide deacetylase family protein [Solirubrobacteraceae bacterium]|jgi:peptidoglycan/xylan/chitin deacetylase (PgdA/CDA1 family)|nr:polysaccharide deacetylase family protein [Solirubrobacteraceae bacterium]
MPDWAVTRRPAGSWLALLAIAALLALITDGESDSAAANRTVRVSPSDPLHATAPKRPTAASRLAGAVTGVLAHSSFVVRGGGEKREIALTFDDGPGPYTPQVLVALNRLHVKATFFVIGQQEQTFHTAMMAENGRGDVIGDHTESHPHLASLSARDQHDELEAPLQGLARYGLPRPQLFRPPYGSYDATTTGELRRMGMLMVLWSVDTQDYLRPGVSQIVANAVSAARPGAIILLHDGGGDRSQTVAAVPQIVARLRAKHYRLVTVPQLLLDDPPPASRRAPRLPITEG